MPTSAEQPLSQEPRNRPDTGDRRVFFAVLAVLLPIYSVTATWALPYHGDALTNAITGWSLGTTGTVIVPDHAALATPEQTGNFSWFVPSPRGPVSQYPPGAAVTAALFYWVAQSEAPPTVMVEMNNSDVPPVEVPIPPMWPATLSAVITTALAAAILSLTFTKLGGSSPQAIAGGLVYGLATTAWAVAANMSWTHGPAMLTISLALLAAASDRWLLCGLSFGASVLVRPHLAIIAAIVGIWVGLSRRSWRPLILSAIGAAVGLATLIGYNYWLWGTVTISGGYGEGFTDHFLHSSATWFARNVLGALFDPWRGLLIWAPYLVVLVPIGIKTRKQMPDWVSAAAVGGILYLLIQLRANRFSGGDGHFAYRYPLETLTAAAPWAFLSYTNGIGKQSRLQLYLIALILGTVCVQLAGATLT